MPNSNRVSLDIRDFPADDDGWTDTTASNGATYSYKYTGGDEAAGSGELTCTVGCGNTAIRLSLIAGRRYRIHSVSFTGDDASQLSTHGNALRSRVIRNKNTAAIEANYHVCVTDARNDNARIPCDPPIVNKHPA